MKIPLNEPTSCSMNYTSKRDTSQNKPPNTLEVSFGFTPPVFFVSPFLSSLTFFDSFLFPGGFCAFESFGEFLTAVDSKQ